MKACLYLSFWKSCCMSQASVNTRFDPLLKEASLWMPP